MRNEAITSSPLSSQIRKANCQFSALVIFRLVKRDDASPNTPNIPRREATQFELSANRRRLQLKESCQSTRREQFLPHQILHPNLGTRSPFSNLSCSRWPFSPASRRQTRIRSRSIVPP